VPRPTDTPAPPTPQPSFDTKAYDERMERLENQLASLANSMTKLTEAALAKRGGRKIESAKGDPLEGIAPLAPYASLAKRLADAEVAAPLIRILMDDMPKDLDDAAAAMEVRTRISQRLQIIDVLESTPGKTRVLALVGATGVGKTTTLTKIAARLSLVSNFSVGIVTMDTHRIAAAKQLETYGEILRVAVKVAYSAEEVNNAIEAYAEEGKEFVLIDTAGKSPNDAMPLAEVASALNEIPDVIKLLCVPATVSWANADHMVARFHSLLAPDAVILTKLDEAADNTYLGHLLGTQAKLGIPLAFVTTGQRVPDDLSRPDTHAIADKILPQSVS
jgi:flagellar biosynthesis protein FlhF